MKNVLLFISTLLLFVSIMTIVFYVGSTSGNRQNVITIVREPGEIVTIVSDETSTRADERRFNETPPQTITVRAVETGTIAQCSDGIDNDGDGKIDYPQDRACSSLNTFLETPPTPTLFLSASPSPTRKNSGTTLSWESLSAESCVLSGSNGDSWILAGISGKEVSSNLTEETTFTLECKDLDGRIFTQHVFIELLPAFEKVSGIM